MKTFRCRFYEGPAPGWKLRRTEFYRHETFDTMVAVVDRIISKASYLATNPKPILVITDQVPDSSAPPRLGGEQSQPELPLP